MYTKKNNEEVVLETLLKQNRIIHKKEFAEKLGITLTELQTIIDKLVEKHPELN